MSNSNCQKPSYAAVAKVGTSSVLVASFADGEKPTEPLNEAAIQKHLDAKSSGLIPLGRYISLFLLVAISKSFKSNSTLSSLILANLQPIDLEIKKRICFTALTGDSFPLPPSSAILVNDKVSSIRRLGPPLTCTYRQFVRSAISTKLADDWNEEWVSSEKASQTRSFFPTVSHSDMLSSCRLHAAMVQVLTGHSLLNGYQAKINRRNSALCDSGAEEETVSHFLFDCSLFHDARAPFKRAIQSLNFSWHPNLSLIPQQASSWHSMVDFIHKSKRFRLNIGSAIRHYPPSCHNSSAIASFSAGLALSSTS